MNKILEDVLAFWFGPDPIDAPRYQERRAIWFAGSASVDEQITRRFCAHVERAALGEYDDHARCPHGALALLLLLDQFPRHIWRGRARAYAFDARARWLCRRALSEGFDEQLSPVERSFMLLPLQHSEAIDDQRDCVAAFEALVKQTPVGDWFHPHALQGRTMARIHSSIIARYGRFPHRNAVLGRPCTLAERMYLDAGGWTFGQQREQEPDPAPAQPETSRRFAIYRPELDPAQTLCVDGRINALRCLSHWPGPPVPAPLRHDLSTGMALRWARLSVAEREQILGRFSIVTNDHYDTDGVLGAYALLEPEDALAHADRMVRTAATGDFRTYNGEDALAVDLTLGALWASPASPLADTLADAADYATKAERCYAYALDHLPGILAHPFTYRDLWEARFDRIMDDIERVEAGLIPVDTYPDVDLAVVYARAPITRMGLVHAAGEHYRVLLVTSGDDGTRYRFLYRNESWFLGIRDRVGERIALTPVVERLDRLEGRSRGGRPGHWWCTGLDQTAPQMGFGAPSDAANVFGDLAPHLDPASRLPPATVVESLADVLREGDRLPRSA